MKLVPAPHFKTTMEALDCLEGITPAITLYLRRAENANYGLFLIFIFLLKSSWASLSKMVMDEETGLYLSDVEINSLKLKDVIEAVGIATKQIEEMEIPSMLLKHSGDFGSFDVAAIYDDVSKIVDVDETLMTTTEALSTLASQALGKMIGKQ